MLKGIRYWDIISKTKQILKISKFILGLGFDPLPLRWQVFYIVVLQKSASIWSRWILKRTQRGFWRILICKKRFRFLFCLCVYLKTIMSCGNQFHIKGFLTILKHIVLTLFVLKLSCFSSSILFLNTFLTLIKCLLIVNLVVTFLPTYVHSKYPNCISVVFVYL